MSGATGQALPQGVGRIGARFVLFACALCGVAGFGAYAYTQQFSRGLVVTGMRSIGSGGASWGLYIVFDVFFIGVSFAGITVASMIRLFGLKQLKPLSRMAELVTIVALLLGGMVVLADLGRPIDGLRNLPRLARPMSPFFGTFTMVIGGYLFASLVYFFLAGRADAATMAGRATHFRWAYRIWAAGFRGTPAEHRRHHEVSFWMSLFILPLLVTAHSTLGFIFGIQAGRPGWYSSLQAPGFVVMAGVSGIGILIVVAALLRRLLHLENEIQPAAFRWLGNFLWILIVVYAYFIIAEELTTSYAGAGKERAFAHELVFGAYRRPFWAAMACLAIPLLMLFSQFVRRRTSIGLCVAAGLIVNVAAVLKRFLLVVPSQTHGMLLSYPEGRYRPSWVELSFVIGLFALGTLLFSLFVKVFPIVPLGGHEPPAREAVTPEPRKRALLRAVAAAANLVVGLTLAAAGLALSARAGTKPFLDPLLPYSPVMFILGVMMTFYTGAVYETFPPTKASSAVGPEGTE